MAMIPCPSCGEMISDKSQKCIHCGYEFPPKEKFCPECGAKLDLNATVCSKCGCPLNAADTVSSAPVEVTVSKSAKKNFTKVIFAVAAIIIIALIAVAGIKLSESKKPRNLPSFIMKTFRMQQVQCYRVLHLPNLAAIS